MPAPVLADDDLISIRKAAAMAHTVGGIRIELRCGERTLATVVGSGRADHPAGSDRVGRVVDACAFRRAVAAAWGDHRAGRPVAVIGQCDGDLDVGWQLDGPGQLLGFGAVRTQCGGRMVWAVPSLLAADRLGAVIAEVDTSTAAAGRGGDEAMVTIPDPMVARIVHDADLDVSVVHLELECAAAQLVAALDELLLRVVAAVGCAEVLAGLAAAEH